jgi:hypothetical protein
MSCSRLALLLIVLSVLLPVRGLAQTPPPLVPAPTEEEPPYEPEAEGSESEGRRWDEPSVSDEAPREHFGLTTGRVTLEFLGGSVLGLAAGIPGAILAVNGAFCDGCESEGAFFAGLSLSFAGLTLGSALGIKGMGSLLGGEGRFLSALAGTSIGGLSGLGLGLLIGFAAGSELWIIPTLAGPIVGGIIAYEASHADARQERSAPSRSATGVLPVVGVSPRGDILCGLAGRF